MSQGFVNSQNITLPLAVAQGGTGVTTSTGSGNTVLSTSPTLVTPILGAATATSVTFSPTTGGIVGTTTNDNVTAGDVGEYVTSNIALASAISISTATNTDLTSISLTAGDWDVWGNIAFVPQGANTVGGATSWISTTSATLPNTSFYNTINNYSQVSTGLIIGTVCVPIRLSLSGTTTVYVTGNIAFGVSTMKMCGNIFARRRR
jgi:hypothetical protein